MGRLQVITGTLGIKLTRGAFGGIHMCSSHDLQCNGQDARGTTCEWCAEIIGFCVDASAESSNCLSFSLRNLPIFAIYLFRDCFAGIQMMCSVIQQCDMRGQATYKRSLKSLHFLLLFVTLVYIP